QSYRELYADNKLNEVYFFFDEIQNISGWQKFVRRMDDSVSKKLFISGSNAKLLSKEIATSLRGRGISVELLPLYWSEYLDFKGIKKDIYSSRGKSKTISLFKQFLMYGSFPEIVAGNKDNDLKRTILQDYFNTMIYNDLVERYQISSVKNIKFFMRQLLASHAKEFSINKIYNTFKSAGLKIGRNSLYDYLDYAETVYLLSTLSKYEKSGRQTELARKKVFIIDNGLWGAVNIKDVDSLSRRLESVVFWYLRSVYEDVFMYKTEDNYECDFVVGGQGRIEKCIQVCLDMEMESTKEREIRALVKACRFFGLKEGWLISLEEDGELEVEGIKIKVVPAWKWMLLV
ncbi:ATP-binding protein, partial [Candidatus Shapirobacteria bacterium]